MFTTVTVVSGLTLLVLLGGDGSSGETTTDHEIPAKLEEESATIRLAIAQN